MCKKIGIVALAVVAGLMLLNKTNLGSYARTAWNKVKIGAKEQVPLEFELERVRNEIAQMAPDMRDHLNAVAEETVYVENLRKDVASAKDDLAKRKNQILVMKEKLTTGKVSLTGRRSDPGKELATAFESYKTAEKTLASKERLLDAKEQGLANAHQQLTAMKEKKEELTVQVAELEAELKLMRVNQTKSDLSIDDSRLSRINDSLKNIRDRMSVLSKRADLEKQFAIETPTAPEKKVKTDDLVKDIDEHFGKAGDVAADKQ